MKIQKFKLLFILLLINMGTYADTILVNTPDDLKKATYNAKPGDIILLKNKIWNDVQLVVNGRGTKENPIVIKPESGNEVLISGKSNLKIAGEYLHISGFHFKNGYSPNDHLVVFRVDNQNLANNCRFSNSVIEDFSQPERFKGDSWIVFWGKNNRVDHCTFINKLNAGPVIIAELNDERSQNNNHSIDHNYFKGRERFGSNGGETIRIGVSRYSLTASKTQIVHNYFERCDGEVEIVSIKSGENNVSFNTFFECEGSLVLRHGSKNEVEGNLFLGNNKPFTGGVRIVNPGHKVINNVFKDLTGTAFRSPLAIMNGVPNSLINRYYQVKDVNIENNSFINCASVLFGAGKDAERTLSPQNVLFSKNLFVGCSNNIIIDDNNDGGIEVKTNAVLGQVNNQGFVAAKTANVNFGNIVLPFNKDYGAPLKNMTFITKAETGAAWFKDDLQPIKVKNKTYDLKIADSKKIISLIKEMNPGDTLQLTESGFYKIEEEIIIGKSITIKAAANLKTKPVFVNGTTKPMLSFITIDNGARLSIKGIAFKGAYDGSSDVKCGIRSTDAPMIKHYKVFIDHCEFYDYNESSFSAFRASKSTLADSLVITNSLFRNISGTAINLSEEREEKGIYSVEHTFIKNCVFTNILGSAINVYRGGNDESTLGPFVTLENCTLNEIDNREQGGAVKLVGVQHANINHCNFINSGQGGRSIEFRELRWDELEIDYSNFYQSGKVESFYNKLMGKHIFNIKPEFNGAYEYDFSLKSSNKLNTMGKGGKAVGASLFQ